MILYDKHGKEIKAGDTLHNPFDRDLYHQVLEDGGKLYLGDLDCPLEKYGTDHYWEIVETGEKTMLGPEEYPPCASELLHKAAQTIEERAAQRDLPAERSMARAVGAFNTLTGQSLTTTQGWLFVAVLKLARATAGKNNPDDLLDAAAYVALALENEILEKEEIT